jgi:hypothetical protein
MILFLKRSPTVSLSPIIVADNEPEPNNEQAAIAFAAQRTLSRGGRDAPPRRNSSCPTPASTSSSC